MVVGKKSSKKSTKKVLKKEKEAETTERPIIYPEFVMEICLAKAGTALTAEQAKELLGWEEETEDVKFGTDFLLTDANGKKIRCYNNVTNRPISRTVYETLKQEHLRKRWRLNGESLIIGRSGLILNGQHTLVALILAAQEWNKGSETYQEWWATEPTMDKTIVYGIEESDDVVNTMDTCKPRTLAEVICRSSFFSTLPKQARIEAARHADYAIRLLWKRTGANIDAFSVRRTHAESLAFLTSHQKIVAAVRHVMEEHGREKRFRWLMGPGYLAGFLYLMGCSTTDPHYYHPPGEPTEESLKWDNWDAACDFVVMLAAEATEVKAVKKYLLELEATGPLTTTDRWAVLVKAWNLFLDEKPITSSSLALKFKNDEDGIRHLIECPTTGGIDLGNNPATSADEALLRGHDPSPETVKTRAAEERAKKTAKKEAQPESPKKTSKAAKKAKPSQRKPGEIAVGDLVWVCLPGREPWRGKLLKLEGNTAHVKVGQGFAGAGNTFEVALNRLQQKQPSPLAEESAAA